MAEIADEDGGTLAHGRNGVFLDLSIRREDTFCEALNHGTRHREILSKISKSLHSEQLPRWIFVLQWRHCPFPTSLFLVYSHQVESFVGLVSWEA